MEEYNKLVGVNEFDHDKARELAKLHEEIETLKRRERFLSEIARKHNNLKEYIWRTANGKYMLVHDMEDSHLKNAVAWQLEHNGSLPFVLQQEYIKRFGDSLPETKTQGRGSMLKLGSPKKWGGFDDDDEMF